MQIETGSRLHFGLIDLSSERGRVDGSIGLGIELPGFKLQAEESDSLRVHGPLQERAEAAANKVMHEYGLEPVEIIIQESLPQHQGLGSGTQLDLAAGFAVAKLNGKDLSTVRVAENVERGGTSGIGTAVFDEGGFILDGGHDFEKKGGFLPSAASNVSPPPVISRFEFPDWNIKIFLPNSTGAYGSDELAVFEEECPIPLIEVHQLSHIILMKLLPSVAREDFGLFRDSINAIQRIGFKKRELQRQPDSLSLVEDLQSQGYAAGMSSLGPTVFAISPSRVDVSYDGLDSIQTKAANNGASFT